ncbi:MAG: hypothetical protein SFT68_02505 [Rickettsiaceae bacterium]|nr:hypothetical protein [Rickettsiaceae bacterium]
MFKNLGPKIIIIWASIFLVSCASNTTIRSSEDAEQIISSRKNLVLLPSIVEVNQLQGISGKPKRMYNYESQIEDLIVDELRDKLAEKGYTPTLLTKKQLFDAKVSAEISMLQEEIPENLKKIYTPLLMEESKARNTNLVFRNPFRGANFFTLDSIIVVPEYTFWSRAGMSQGLNIAASLLLGKHAGASSIGERAVLRLTFIDPVDFKLLWSDILTQDTDILYSATIQSMSNNNKVERSRLKTMFKALIRRIPNYGATPKQQKK